MLLARCAGVGSTRYMYRRAWHAGHSHSHGEEDLRSHKDDPGYKEGVRITQLGGLSNVALTGLKGAAGIVGNSPAMMADAIHSLSDLLSDGVAMWAFVMGRQPADENHPYGHGKFETIGSLAVSGLLGLGGFGIVAHSYDCLVSAMSSDVAVVSTSLGYYTGEPIPAVALGVAAFSLVLKEYLYHATMKVAKQTHSNTLVGNAWHHRSDSLSSLVAFVGIGGSMAGFPLLDPLAGIIVGLMIVKQSAELGWDSFKELTDEVDVGMTKELERIASQIPGVESCYDVRARKMGHYTLVDLQIQLSDKYSSVSSAVQVEERVRNTLIASNPRISEVIVRIRAEDSREDNIHLMREQSLIEEEIRKRVAQQVQHKLEITRVGFHFLNKQLYVQLEIVVDEELRVRDVNKIAASIRRSVEELDDVHRAEIFLDLDEGHKPSGRSGTIV